MLMSSLLVALHFGLMAAVIVRVLLRRPARGVALAWLLLAVVLPYAGAVAYFLIGERRLPRIREERLAQYQDDIRRIASAAPTDPIEAGEDPKKPKEEADERPTLKRRNP